MSILGNRVLRSEDPRLLTAGGQYVTDLDLDGALHVHYVVSTVANARVLEVDASEARVSEGVVAVFLGGDLSLQPLAAMGTSRQGYARPFLAQEVVRYVGQPVAMVVATSAVLAADASELVFVDYEPLPVVTDLEEAASDRIRIVEGEDSNVISTMGDTFTEDFFDDADVVVKLRFVNQRVAPVPLEGRAAAAEVDPSGKLTFYASTQTPHAVKSAIVSALGMDGTQVRVVTPDVGGGFGAKATQYVEELLDAYAARELGRPVKWVEPRSQNLTGLGHGRAQVQLLELGATAEGVFTGYRMDVLQDTGAYPGIGGFLPMLTYRMAPGVYRIPKVEFKSRSVVTNTTTTVAYRGAGRPEATSAIERIVDLMAKRLDIDPAELRRRNLIPGDAFPYATVTGSRYDSGDYEGALDKLLLHARYGELRSEQAERRRRGDVVQLGIGLSIYVEVTNGFPSSEFGAVEVTADGRAIVRSGTSPHGQGHFTAYSMIVSESLGIPMDRIEVITGDTDVVPRGVGTFGSRSLQVGGVAVSDAAATVLERAKRLGAELLEANPDDLVVSDGGVGLNVAGTPSQYVTWSQLATRAENGGERLLAEIDFGAESPTYPFGAHLAVVEVDTEIGRVELKRVIAVDDAGRILAPLMAEGQVHGGIAQGAAQALIEEVVYDEYGNPLTSNLADYGLISATELPSFEIIHQETPTYVNSLGVKGIGESGTIGATPAVHNAVIDAISHLGVDHVDMPTTAERIWKALGASATRR